MKRCIQYLNVLAWLCSMVMLMSGCKSRELIFEEASVSSTSEEVSAEKTTAESQAIFVHVCGEVNKPGVYEAPSGSRYQDLIDLAGGMTDEASRDYLNLARVAEDGEKIVVPRIGEASESYAVEMTEADDGKVNLNTANLTELMSLPGIGKAKAGAIIAYREEVSAFEAIEDVMKVAGIKQAAFTQIKEYIKVK